jgi:hypothetical protein
MSQYRAIISTTSTLGENLVVNPNVHNIAPGEDFVVYDTWEKKYKILKRKTYIPQTFNSDRYNTNYDIVLGVYGDTLRAVASDDAYGYTDMVNTDTAAAPCYYRIEIDTSTEGSFNCTIKPYNNVIFNITWNSGDSMDSILTQFQNIQQNQTTDDGIKSYTSFAVLDDGTGIGIAVGYYSSNTCSISDVNGNVNLIDMSKFAVYDKGVKYNDDYNLDLEVINSNFKNWEGVSVQTIMGSDIVPIGPNSGCIANNGINYYYRNGINYNGWRSWVSTQTEGNYFISDGVNGSTYTNELIMNKSIFDSNVNSSAVVDSDAYKMYVYYNNLLNSNGAEFKAKHDLYVSRYGEMEDLYGAYLMSHMVNTDNPTSGIVYTCMNYGPELTQVKGKIFTVTYNYKYYPAYPPEYNALQYGLDDNSRGFGKGMYYHPEPYDISVMLRDDMMEKLNNNFIEGNFTVTKLANNVYRGTCAEYHSYATWNFNGDGRYLRHYARYTSVFRCRPVLAFAL